MTLTLDDSIAAIASGPGAGGIGIIRISGSESKNILEQLFKPLDDKVGLEHAHLVPGHIIDPGSGAKLDFVLAVCFMAPRSYTGQEVVEIQAHGGRLNLEQILAWVLKLGARAAGPGEFTLRAFQNGRIDLPRAEAVRELIESQTAAALNASRRHLGGDISRLCGKLREQIIQILAHIEAMVDFPDEDLPPEDRSQYLDRLMDIQKTLEEASATYSRGRLLHQGVETMIVGLPNVGKSSLLNALLRSDRAIVTDQPGTTRDLIEAQADLAGVPVRFVDSAGLREGAEDVEAIGVQRARQRLENTDFVLWVLDRSRPLLEDEGRLAKKLSGHRGILVINKSDLPARISEADVADLLPWPRVELSAKLGEGLQALEQSIGDLLDRPATDADELVLTSARHQSAFLKAAAAISRINPALKSHEPAWELLAADLHEALYQLEEVIGVCTPEDILEEIFSNFCIGK